MKMCLIGIDGGTFTVMNPLFENGELPNLKSLIDDGYHSVLNSTIPAVTAPAWTSFMTGKNPGKHGLFDFFTAGDETSYRRPFSSYKDIKTKTIWQLMTEAGLKVGIMNVPLTYPPEKVNGFVIPGMQYSMSGKESFTHPPDLMDKLGSEFRVGVEYDGSLRKYASDLIEVVEEHMSLVPKLITEYEPDVFMIVFKITDAAQHFFWRFYDKNHPQHDDTLAEEYGQVIPDMYRTVDKAVGRLFDILPGDPDYVVLSDHGAGPQVCDFLINRWLIREGYMKPKRLLMPLWKIKYPRDFWRLLHKIGIPGIGGQPPSYWEKEIRDLIDPRQALYHDMLIDWKNTKAYFGNMTEQGIYINLKGRQPQGIVKQGAEYEDLRDELISKLLAFKDEKSGESAVKNVFKREDIYKGPWVKDAPDLIVYPNEKGFLGHKYFYPDEICVDSVRISGTHRTEGILFLNGKGIEQRKTGSPNEIIDVAPTVLYMLGLPILRDMDGKVVKEAFGVDYFESNQPKYIDDESSTDIQMKNETDGSVYTKDDEDNMTKHLKGLGYI